MPKSNQIKPAATAKLAVTTEDAAAMLGISPKTLANWRVLGRGPAYVRVGARRSPVLYRVDDLEAWLDSHRVGA